MSFQERDYYKSRLEFSKRTSSLVILLGINLVIFAVLAFFKAVAFLKQADNSVAMLYFQEGVLDRFSLSTNIEFLIKRPWTIITHAFVHGEVWPLVGNMLWLWVFGYILQDITGSKKIIPVYIYGSLLGAVAFLLAYNLLPGLKSEAPGLTYLGASAGVMAVAMATTAINPRYRLLPALNGGIPIWVIMLVYLVVDIATIHAGMGGYRIAHIAGAVAGYGYVASYKRGVDWGAWMNNSYDWLMNVFNPERNNPKPTPIKEELFYNAKVTPYTKTAYLSEERVNQILDKIIEDGYESLTTEEKDMLKRASDEGL